MGGGAAHRMTLLRRGPSGTSVGSHRAPRLQLGGHCPWLEAEALVGGGCPCACQGGLAADHLGGPRLSSPPLLGAPRRKKREGGGRMTTFGASSDPEADSSDSPGERDWHSMLCAGAWLHSLFRAGSALANDSVLHRPCLACAQCLESRVEASSAALPSIGHEV